MIKVFFFICSLVTLGYSLFLVAEHWEYEETAADINHMFRTSVSAAQMDDEINNNIENGHLDDARMYSTLAKKLGYQLDYESYERRILEKDTVTHRVQKNTGNFVQGFISGRADTGAGLAGAVSSDFTVVGDARDLSQQYQNYQDGKPVNQLIVALSGVGIGLTAATLTSLGTTAPVKAGTSVLKSASKTGRLTKRFSKELLQRAHKVFDWQHFRRLAKADGSVSGIRAAAKAAYNPKAYRAISKIVDQTNDIRKATSAVDTIYLLKYVENTDDLRRMNKLSQQYGMYTRGVMKFLGKSALRGTRILKRTMDFIFSALSTLFSFILSVLLMPLSKKGA